MLSMTNARRNKYKGLLQNVDLLKEMTEQELLFFADALVEQTFNDADVVCRQGVKGDTFYLVKEVSARVREKN